MMETRGKASRRRGRRRTIFFPPRHKKLSDIISIESPAFRDSIRRLKRRGIGPTEKRAVVLAQNRAKAMLKKRSLSANERRQLHSIARMPLPPAAQKAA
jgi:hypothetical protein